MAAIENLLCRLYVLRAAEEGLSAEELRRRNHEFLERARLSTAPLSEPTVSDLAAAEFSDALSRLLDLQGKLGERLLANPKD